MQLPIRNLNGEIMSALIPAWIIGAPLLLAIVDLIRTPKANGTRLEAAMNRA